MSDLRIVGWKRWQGPGVYEVNRRRKKGSKRPLKLAFVSVAVEFNDDPEATPGQGSFEDFAAALGAGANAEGWWIRVLQYLGANDPLEGVIRRVPRERFGPVVLSRKWDQVSAAKGAKVYDALVSSRLADRVIDRAIDREDARENDRATAPEKIRPDFDSDFGSKSESKTDSDVVVDSRSAPGTSTSGVSPPPSTSEAEAQAEKDRALTYAKASKDERAQQDRAAMASRRPPSEPQPAKFHLPPRAAS